VTSPAPTHSTPQPRQHPSSTRARPLSPVSPVHVASTPCAGHPLGALVPASLAYKSPRRSNDWTHTIPSYLPDTLTSSRSLPFDVTSPAGEVLDAEGAAAFDLRWARGRRELVEESRRSLFRPSLSSSASSTRLAVAVVFLAVRRWGPSSPTNTTQMRRWIRIQRQHTDSGHLSDLTSGTPLSVHFKTFPARGEAVWAGPFGFHLKSAQLGSNSVRFVLFNFPPISN
jgi:hypothetical protein